MKKLENDNNFEYIKLVYDFKYSAVREAALAVSKGMSIYLTITAVLIGYIFTQNIETEIKAKAIYVGLSTAFFAFIACSSIGWGIIKGLKSIELLFKKSNNLLYKDLEVDKFIKRGRIAVIITMISSICVLLVFSYAMINLKF